MWRYHTPTDEQREQVSEILNFKLEHFPQANNVVPRSGKFNVKHTLNKLFDINVTATDRPLSETPIWFYILMHFLLTTGPDKTEGKRGIITKEEAKTIMAKYNFPSHKEFVETQWRYMLELMITHCESLSETNRASFRGLLQMYSISFGDLSPYLLPSMWHSLFGIPLVGYTSLSILLMAWQRIPNGVHPTMLFSTGLPQYGNIMVLDVNAPSLQLWLEKLQRNNYEMVINIRNSATPNAHDATGYFTRLIAFQITDGCKLGCMTDGTFYVFTTIVRVTEFEIKVKLDVTISLDEFDEDNQMYPPTALMVAKMAQIHQMNPMDYRSEIGRGLIYARNWAQKVYWDFYVNDTTNKEIFQLLKNVWGLSDSQQLDVYYPFQRSNILTPQGKYHSHVFTIPKTCLGVSLPHNIPGNDVVVKIFDMADNFINEDCYLTSELLLFRYYEYVDHLERVNHYNRGNGCKINTIERLFGWYLSFWQDESMPKDARNYSYSGLTVIMEKLTEKPKTRDDFLKGLQQLIIMNHGGLANFELDYQDMFMRDGDFVFTSFGSSGTEYNRRQIYDCPFSSQVESFFNIWRIFDRGIGYTSVTEAVDHFQAVIQSKIDQ